MSITGDALIAVSGVAPRREIFSAPVQIEGTPALDTPGHVTMVFDGPEVAFTTPIAAQALAWSRDIRDYSDHPKSPSKESSIASGVISLREFKDRATQLQSGQLLQLGDASGTIRRLRVDGSAVYCRFDSTVRQLSTEEGNITWNLMPTWLAWLAERNTLAQFWGVFASVVGVAFAAMRWWRQPE